MHTNSPSWIVAHELAEAKDEQVPASSSSSASHVLWPSLPLGVDTLSSDFQGLPAARAIG